MLVRMSPDQVSNNWDLVKYTIQETVPPIHNESPEKLNSIFESLLIGSMQCWASIQKTSEEGTVIEGLVITTVIEDRFSRTKNLLVYVIYSFANKSIISSWTEGLKTLMKYAKSRGCEAIVGYTKNKDLVKYVERIGANVQTFISIPLLKK